MILRPTSLSELPVLLAQTQARGERISAFDLSALNRVLEHNAADMTVVAEAGASVAELQERLAQRGQWLPVDPPRAPSLSVGALLASDDSGARRFGCGTVRDYLLGIKVVLANGQLISSGGKVVKNVAGYDMGKLFVGSRGSLGVIVEAVFKLCPLPEAETFVEARFGSVDDAGKAVDAVLDSELVPIVLDLHKATPAIGHFTVVLGFAGPREEVQWQLERAGDLDFKHSSSLEYQESFWNGASAPSEHEPIRKRSVLPSNLIATLGTLAGPFVARAGNGIIYYRGQPPAQDQDLPLKLSQRLKHTFDPLNILPDSPL